MKPSIYVLLLYCLLVPLGVDAQIFDSLILSRDTIPTVSDSVGRDSLMGAFARQPARTIRLSNNGLDAQVKYNARDSMILSNREQKAYLYGKAFIEYTTLTLEANYIELDWENNIVIAEAGFDSTTQTYQTVHFADKEQVFDAERIRYNFETEKGIVFDVSTQQDDIYLHGGRTKFFGANEADSSQAETVLFGQDLIFTTCDLPHPHFGIRSSKQKVVPNKQVIVGPSQLEIMGAPTPLWLPFGFFPISKSNGKSGLLFPRDYEFSEQWGFGLRDVGWFFPINDNFNLALRSNIYFRGTWGISASSQYRQRYKYAGSIELGYDSRNNLVNDTLRLRNNSGRLRWSHRQDRAAHPYNSFGGSINIQANNYQSNVFNDPGNVLQSQFSSNMTFTRNFPDQPFTFTAAFNHTQNTQNNQVVINFPDMRFQTQALYPFRRKNVGGNQRRWYEDIVVRYTAEGKSRITATDTTLFEPETLENARFGIQQNLALSNSFKLFKYFNLNPNIQYREVWQWKTLDREFDPSLQEIEIDSFIDPETGETFFDTTVVSQGEVVTDTVSGFAPWRTYSAGLSLQTRIFGTLLFRKGKIRGLRHEFRPTFGFTFAPDYLDPSLGYYQEVQIDPENPDQTQIFDRFQGGIFGSPPRAGQQMALTYSLNNIFQAKVFSKKDSTIKDVKLIDNLVVNGSYNFAADSLNWSPVNLRTTARFFKGITTVGISAQWDPYIKNERNQRLNTFAIDATGDLLRFDNARFTFTTNITVGKLRELLFGEPEEVVEDLEEEARKRRRRAREGAEEDFLSLFENFRLSHNLAFGWEDRGKGPEFNMTTHALNARGQITLTPNWSLNVGNIGYDFVRKDFSYPSLGLLRDLHCWEMSVNWQPTRSVYSFNLRVKPGTLDFLKVPYQRNNADGFTDPFQ